MACKLWGQIRSLAPASKVVYTMAYNIWACQDARGCRSSKTRHPLNHVFVLNRLGQRPEPSYPRLGYHAGPGPESSCLRSVQTLFPAYPGTEPRSNARRKRRNLALEVRKHFLKCTREVELAFCSDELEISPQSPAIGLCFLCTSTATSSMVLRTPRRGRTRDRCTARSPVTCTVLADALLASVYLWACRAGQCARREGRPQCAPAEDASLSLGHLMGQAPSCTVYTPISFTSILSRAPTDT